MGVDLIDGMCLNFMFVCNLWLNGCLMDGYGVVLDWFVLLCCDVDVDGVLLWYWEVDFVCVLYVDW